MIHELTRSTARMICRFLWAGILVALTTSLSLAQTNTDALETLITDRITYIILHQYSGATRENLNINFSLPNAVDSLAECTHAPTVDASRDRWLGSIRLTINCSDDPGWRVNVRAEVGLRLPVAVLDRSLPRNHVLTENDITFQEKNIADLRQGYFLDADAVAGTSLVRSLNSGHTLTHRNVEVPTMIQRGDSVSILAQSGGMMVSMEGTALADGAHGRQISVRNNSSGQEIRAWVVDRGVVEVPFVSRNSGLNAP